MSKGLYGQMQGNETRASGAVWADYLHIDELIEGNEVAILHRMAIERDWKALDGFCKELRQRGHAQFRVDAMLSKSMYGLKL